MDFIPAKRLAYEVPGKVSRTVLLHLIVFFALSLFLKKKRKEMIQRDKH